MTSVALPSQQSTATTSIQTSSLSSTVARLVVVFSLSVVLMPDAVNANDPPQALKRIEATDSFRAVARFPKDVRHAILELTRYPRVVWALSRAGDLNAETIAEHTRGYQQDVREAATRLIDVPDAIAVMASNMDVTTLIGVVYSEHKDELLQAAARLHEQLKRSDAAAFTQWFKLLEGNEKARDELVAAADDYAAERLDATRNTSSVDSASSPISASFGFYVSPTFEPVFYTLPAYRPVIYVLYNADRYPNLADVCLTYWQARVTYVPLYYAVNDWWRLWSPYYTTNFLLADGGRTRRLQEAAQFEKRYARAGDARSRGLTREAFRSRNATAYRNIAAVQRTTAQPERDRDRDRDRDRFDRPTDPRSRTTASSRTQTRDARLANSRALIQQRAQAASAQRKARIDMSRRMSARQQYSRATQNMQRAWSTSRGAWGSSGGSASGQRRGQRSGRGGR